MRVFSKIQQALVVAPNFPNIIPGLDTQPFFVFAFFQNIKKSARINFLYIIFNTVFLFEFVVNGAENSISDVIVFMIFIFLVCYARLSTQQIHSFQSGLKVLIAILLIASVTRYAFPFIEPLFSPRLEVAGLGRSFSYIYPEASYAAKTLFFLYCFLLISTGFSSRALIVMQLATLSLTGFVTAVISIFYFFYFSDVRRSVFLIFVFVLCSVLTIFFIPDGEILNMIPTSRVKYIITIANDAGLMGVISFLSTDESFLYRILAPLELQTGSDLNSLISYILTFPVSSISLILFLLLTNVDLLLERRVLMLRIIILSVAGYADSFVYPSLILALTARRLRKWQ